MDFHERNPFETPRPMIAGTWWPEGSTFRLFLGRGDLGLTLNRPSEGHR